MDKENLGQSVGNSVDTIETTVGDLIEAITEIALETGKSKEEGYKLASMTIENILRRHKKEFEIVLN